MTVNPDIFPVEDLVLDRLYANLVESEKTVELTELMLRNDLVPEERAHYEARLAEEQAQIPLLRELIERRRTYELEKSNGTT